MEIKGLAELRANLKKLNDYTNREVVAGMELWQNEVVTLAKADHVWYKSLPKATVVAHPDRRFYTHTAKLVNSIQPRPVDVFANGIVGTVVATEPYAARVELGSERSRAFPFLGPAAVQSRTRGIEFMAVATARALNAIT